MKKKYLFSLVAAVLALFFSPEKTFSQGDQSPLSLEATYISDVAAVINGGIQTGVTYLGMIDLVATLNTEKAGLWSNGLLYLEMQNTHGATPTGTHVGDAQVFSNIENGNFSYLYQLWYSQQFENFSFLAGIHDLNAEFLASEYAGEYVNSSFGIMPSVSLNVPVSIFPKTALGWIARFHPTERVRFQVAMYDGDPMSIEDPMMQSFGLSEQEGHLSIAELSIATSKNESFPGTIKVGGYFHSAKCASILNPVDECEGNYGGYAILDQMVLPFNDDGEKGLGFFGFMGMAPSDRNLSPFSWGMGLNLMAPFRGRTQDVFGMAMTNATIQEMDQEMVLSSGNETVIECMYKLQVGENILFQPEIQYIINPGGLHAHANATVGLLRTYITF